MKVFHGTENPPLIPGTVTDCEAPTSKLPFTVVETERVRDPEWIVPLTLPPPVVVVDVSSVMLTGGVCGEVGGFGAPAKAGPQRSATVAPASRKCRMRAPFFE
jgi:hypothetical protein